MSLSSKIRPKNLTADAPALLVACGLACGGSIVIRINLLPHREEKRKSRRQQFILFAIAALGGLLRVVHRALHHRWLCRWPGPEERLLKEEIALLDKEIAEIKGLREQAEALLSRKQVIESLQTNRTEPFIFNELARQIPEGLYLKSLKQTGFAHQHHRLRPVQRAGSNLMRNLDASPQLPERRADRGQGRRAQHPPGERVQPQRHPRAPAGRAAENSRERLPSAGVSRNGSPGRSPENLRPWIFKACCVTSRGLDPNDPGQWPLAHGFATLLAIFLRPRRRRVVVRLERSAGAAGGQARRGNPQGRLGGQEAQAVNLPRVPPPAQRDRPPVRRAAQAAAEPFRDGSRCWPTSTRRASGAACSSSSSSLAPRSSKDFYAELPIAVRVTGSYHDLGEFVGDVAQMPRIVTLNDIAIETQKEGGRLKFDATAMTYRYLDDEEVARLRKERPKKRRAK